MVARIKASNYIANMHPPPPGYYAQWSTAKDRNINSVFDEKAKAGSGTFVFITNKPFLTNDIEQIQDGVLVICAQNIATFLRTFATANVYCTDLPQGAGTKVPVPRSTSAKKQAKEKRQKTDKHPEEMEEKKRKKDGGEGDGSTKSRKES